mmetsp:Transcript_1491/g.2461  ORF Transcript_1491/g.2461 Transcript_1491/m.2461 type:complete len:847 (-) Transcript_1491:37-2577(-)
MLGKLVGRLIVLEQQVASFSNLYVDTYEAQCLSSVEIVAGKTTILPAMKKLRKLSDEINGILNEAYILQQSVYAEIEAELKKFSGTARGIIRVLRPEQSSRGERILDEEELVSYSSLETEIMTVEQAKSTEMHLKVRILALYEQVASQVDDKMKMLRIIQKLCKTYAHSMNLLATNSGVLDAENKVGLIIREYMDPLLHNRIFSTDKEEALYVSVRRIWAFLVLASSDREHFAGRQLSIEHFSTRTSASADERGRFHIKIGGIVVLLFWAASECLNNESSGTRLIWNDQTFSIFMCFGDLLLLLVMWGLSMQVWRHAGIDFVRLLELEKSDLVQRARPEAVVYSSCANLCLAFLAAFILFNKAVRGGYFSTKSNLTIAHAIPALFVVFCIFRMVFPFQTRKIWLHMLWRVLAAPFFAVSFRDGYIGDLLTSLVRVMVPLCFSIMYVFITLYGWLSNHLRLTARRSDDWWTHTYYYHEILVPFLTLMPLWLRLMQCLRRSVESGQRWPHMGNALKYTSAIVVIAYGTYQERLRSHPLWIAALVFATLFQFTWDITQDWGMVEIHPPRAAALMDISQSTGVPGVDYILNCSIGFRETRLLGPAGVYALVMLFNLCLRFAWTLTLLPAPSEEETASPSLYVSFTTHLGPLLASAEIVRRMVWGFFRLEFEQLEVLRKTAPSADEELRFEEEMSTTGASDTDGGLNSFGKLKKMDISSSVELQPVDLVGITGSSSIHARSLGGGGYDLANNDQIGDGNESPSSIPAAPILNSTAARERERVNAPAADSSWTEADWTEILPRYARASISSLGLLTGASYSSYNSKVRFLESIVFTTVVVLLILHAANSDIS